ncbi:MAG: lipocalin-like domain-containing protein [Prevotella sp.]|nr:lipocalin-like domain-containing protein [Prevotella sp.]
MKRFLFIFSIVSGLLFTSCDIETSKNGDLDGYWHLVGVDTLSNSGQTDLSDQVVFWAFQARMLQLRGTEQELYMRFQHEGDQLVLSAPHLRDREREDPEVTEEYMNFLYPYGINAKEERFNVLRLTGDDMVLQSATLQLRFRKQ